MSPSSVPRPIRFGVFVAPFHPADEDPTEQLHRDLAFLQHLDALGYDEAWIGEHHSGGYEIIPSPELFIAHAAAITRRIRLGTGVVSLPYHNPLMVADRILQLDHQTRGRVMLGCGPGQLVTDAFMLGIEPSEQRRMMAEALEVIVPLLRGEVVTRKTDWFDLQNASSQLPPYQWPSPEVAVAGAISPTGAIAAGRHGVGLLSLAASGPEGYEVLPRHWEVCEETAAKNGHMVDRSNWRLVVPMHIAETREQALADMEWGTLKLAHYMETLGGERPDFAGSTADMLEAWMGPGLPIFGKLTCGTPDDAIALIESLRAKSGGFGTVLFLVHNCANPAATRKSYELIARHVVPAINARNRLRERSMAWATENASTFMPAMAGSIAKAITEYERDRAESGGQGTAWSAGVELVGADSDAD
jgi:limonene 1,2-monooxygenase